MFTFAFVSKAKQDVAIVKEIKDIAYHTYTVAQVVEKLKTVPGYQLVVVYTPDDCPDKLDAMRQLVSLVGRD